MKTFIECVPCIINQGIETAKKFNLSEEETEILVKDILITLYNEELKNTPPYFVKTVHNRLKKLLKRDDLYKEIKDFYNNKILGIEEDIKKQIELSEDKFLTAVKLSILGNIIDFGAKKEVDNEKLIKDISTIDSFKLEIDNSKYLYESLKKSKTVLYLADNCGEIVFDKIFMEYIKNNFKDIEIFCAVRGEPIINDATLEDALSVGIDKVATIISNGDSAPGTIIENTTDEFKNIFKSADTVISKGQGNYESLSNTDKSSLFFLFMAKCNLIANELNVPKMSLICK